MGKGKVSVAPEWRLGIVVIVAAFGSEGSGFHKYKFSAYLQSAMLMIVYLRKSYVLTDKHAYIRLMYRMV
jgi:hypothetical protein